MLEYLLLVLLTFVFVLVVLLVFIRVGTPIYRVERVNIIALLQLVVDGKATDADWDVFAGVPIRHDSELEAVQKRCLEIAERHYIGGRRRLFSPEGLDELRVILEQLQRDEAAAGDAAAAPHKPVSPSTGKSRKSKDDQH